jgi:hypothetical protein
MSSYAALVWLVNLDQFFNREASDVQIQWLDDAHRTGV